MSFLKYRFLIPILAVIMLHAFASCSSGSSAISTSASGSVTGTAGVLRAADGSPIAGASVAISTGSSSNLKKYLSDNSGRWMRLPQLTDADGITCDDLSVSSDQLLAYDCTAADGAYTLSGTIPCNTPITFYAKKGSFSISASITISCPTDSSTTTTLDDIGLSDDCMVDDTASTWGDDGEDTTDDADDSESDELSLTKSRPAATMDSCTPELANIAVVTGNYDDIENVIGKLLDSSAMVDGSLDKTADPSTFGFDLIDGNNELDDSAFTNFDEFVNGETDLSVYDIIFINCGNSYESLSIDSEVQALLQEYVEAGGKLYVTDWSYMFIEQNYPGFMDYSDGGTDPSVAESPYTAAKDGTGGITSDATVNDVFMAEWLDSVYVNPNTDDTGPGDPDDDCSINSPGYDDYYYLKTTDSTSDSAATWQGARNADETITIADFLGGWVVMEAVHSGLEDLAEPEEEPTVWISGPITYSPSDVYVSSITDAPLTASRDQGLGRILYSSYHTAHSCPTTGFWPQERVLQYLVWEL
ncbi:MAG: hypothetical protein HQM16_11075 [Deltaproteobacteria bacterium]|nr:hypothetical protein [Deltaproteobacteria bacterium]